MGAVGCMAVAARRIGGSCTVLAAVRAAKANWGGFYVCWGTDGRVQGVRCARQVPPAASCL